MIVCIYNVPANRANWSAIRVIKEAKPVAVVDGELYTIVNKGTVVVYGPGPLPLTKGERYYLAAFPDKPDTATNRYPACTPSRPCMWARRQHRLAVARSTVPNSPPPPCSHR